MLVLLAAFRVKLSGLKAAAQDLTNADTIVEIIKTLFEIFKINLTRQQPIDRQTSAHECLGIKRAPGWRYPYRFP